MPPPGLRPIPWAHLDLSGSLADAVRRIQREAEKRKIEQALEEAAGDAGRASELLEVPYKTLLAKLSGHGGGA